MRRFILILLTLLLTTSFVIAQSGRKGAIKKPEDSPVPPPAATPSPSPVSSKPEQLVAPPKVVDGERIYTTRELDERPQILRKPPPHYPHDETRPPRPRHVVVVLRAILAADEKIKHIELINGIPDSFVEKAVEAARQIKFKPGIKDGKPVSAWVGLEYHFDLF